MSAGLIEKNIDGSNYEFEKWGAEKSLDVLIEISKVVGKSFGMIFGAGMKSFDDEMGPDLLGEVFGALTDRMDKNTIKTIIKQLCSDGVFCEGAKINFNLHYQDRLDHMINVVRTGLDVQYGNFFNALTGFMGKRNEKQPVIKNQSDSTG